MLNKQFSINKIGGGNFEKSELTKTRNVLTKGRLSLFVGAMIAALFVCFAVGCTTDIPDDQLPKSPDDAAKVTNPRVDSTKNVGVNVNFKCDTDYADTLDYEF